MEAPSNMSRFFVRDAALIGNWDEVTDIELSKITKKETDTEKLDGLIIKGYETKFNVTNENGERYDPNCLDEFIKRYFVEHKLNMVVDVQHGWDIDSQIGRVIYLEVNSVGFYFVAYIPRRLPRYEQIKMMLEEGILQGFSKCGYADEWENHYNSETGEWEYVTFKKFALMSVSLVTMPANSIPFEAMGETKNALQYVNKLIADNPKPEKKSIFKQ